MPTFEYKVIDSKGQSKNGKIEATDLTAARSSLVRLGLKPILVKQAGKEPFDLMTLFNKGGGKVKTKDLVVFTRQLATMINAGVPLVRSLATLQNQTENPSFKKQLISISKDVESGMAFADSLQKFPNTFNPTYVNMIKAGEAGGILDEILNKLAIQQEKDAAIKAKFKSAMTYPAVLIGITVLVFIALMTFVVPKIGTIIADLSEGELPPLTKAMLGISDIMINFWYIHISVIVFGGIFLMKYIKTPKGRANKDKLLLKMPGFNILITKMAVARFSRIFASLMSAGVSVIDAIEITAKAIGNTVFEKELMQAAKAVANGEQLSAPLMKSDVFPPIVSQMMAIGEETGQTDTVLVKVAEFYEEEVDAAVEGISSILEPILIVVMGGMVGVIAISVIGPISSLSKNI
jgi:type IV pilus assembly protein PilC